MLNRTSDRAGRWTGCVAGLMTLFAAAVSGATPPGQVRVPASQAARRYAIADLEIQTLAAEPGRYFGRCAIEELPDGTWFLVYHESGHHFKYEPQEPKPILSGVLHAKFSADRGETWSKEDHHLDGTPVRGFPAYPPGAEPTRGTYEPGEPWTCLTPNGDLVVLSCKYNINRKRWDGTWQMRSSDGGRTWTKFQKIDFVGIEHDNDIWAIDDHFVRDGVIYLGAREIRKIGSGMRNLLVTSADSGKTWRFVSYMAEKTGLTTEQGIEYVGGESILCVLNSVDKRHTWQTRSDDMGKTWQPLRDIAPQTGIWDRPRIFTAAHLRREKAWWKDPLILGASDQRTQVGKSFPRRNCLWVSPDRGANWQRLALDEETEDSGYGDMAYDERSGRYVAILYHGTHTEAVLKQYKFRLVGEDGAVEEAAGRDFLAGGDISALAAIEKAGGVYRDGGKAGDAIEILRRKGWNCFRLRLFVDPTHKNLVVNDLPYTIALAKRIKASGAKLLLNVHYSDTWADPGKQGKPAAWEKLDFPALEKTVRTYSRDCIAKFKAAGALPDMVQIGNEIGPGMLWPDGKLHGVGEPEQQRVQFGRLLKAGAAGVKDGAGKSPIRIMIHVQFGASRRGTERFFENVSKQGVPYDVIGLSFYPFWHGSIEDLRENLHSAAGTFGKDMIVVETAYPHRLVKPSTKLEWKAGNLVWPQTSEGQKAYVEQLVKTVRSTPDGRGIGVMWWFPEAVPARGVRLWFGGGMALFGPDGEVLPAAAALAGTP